MKAFFIFIVALIFSLFVAARYSRAETLPPTPLTYVSVSTFTPSGALTTPWVFQNTDSALDVRILKLELASASTQTVTGGLMQFYLYASTSVTVSTITPGTSQTYFYDYGKAAPSASAPSYITVSTAPSSPLYESALPLYRPFVLNNDETATDHFFDSWDPTAPANGAELLLPHGANRALVLEQHRLGTSDITAGVVLVRVLYSVK